MALLFLFTTGAAAGGRLGGGSRAGWPSGPRGWDGPVHRHGTLHCTQTLHRRLSWPGAGVVPICQQASQRVKALTRIVASTLSASHSAVPSYAPKKLSLHAGCRANVHPGLMAKVHIFILNARLQTGIRCTYPCCKQGCGEPIHAA